MKLTLRIGTLTIHGPALTRVERAALGDLDTHRQNRRGIGSYLQKSLSPIVVEPDQTRSYSPTLQRSHRVQPRSGSRVQYRENLS